MLPGFYLVRPGAGAMPWGRGAAAGGNAAGQQDSRVGEFGDMSVKSGKYCLSLAWRRDGSRGFLVVVAVAGAGLDRADCGVAAAAVEDSNRRSGAGVNNRLNFHESISLDDEYNIAIPHKDAASSQRPGPGRGRSRREGEGVMRLIHLFHLSQPVANGARRPLLRSAAAF